MKTINIAKLLKKNKFEERIVNTTKWFIEDFDRNFKHTIANTLQEHLDSLLKEMIKAELGDLLREKIQERAPKIIDEVLQKALKEKVIESFSYPVEVERNEY